MHHRAKAKENMSFQVMIVDHVFLWLMIEMKVLDVFVPIKKTVM